MAAIDKILNLADGGFLSRKLVYALLTSSLVFGGFALVARFPAMGVQYPTCVGGLLAALATYCGANVSHGYLMGKHAVALGQAEGSDADADAEPEKKGS